MRREHALVPEMEQSKTPISLNNTLNSSIFDASSIDFFLENENLMENKLKVRKKRHLNSAESFIVSKSRKNKKILLVNLEKPVTPSNHLIEVKTHNPKISKLISKKKKQPLLVYQQAPQRVRPMVYLNQADDRFTLKEKELASEYHENLFRRHIPQDHSFDDENSLNRNIIDNFENSNIDILPRHSVSTSSKIQLIEMPKNNPIDNRIFPRKANFPLRSVLLAPDNNTINSVAIEEPIMIRNRSMKQNGIYEDDYKTHLSQYKYNQFPSNHSAKNFNLSASAFKLPLSYILFATFLSICSSVFFFTIAAQKPKCIALTTTNKISATTITSSYMSSNITAFSKPSTITLFSTSLGSNKTPTLNTQVSVSVSSQSTTISNKPATSNPNQSTLSTASTITSSTTKPVSTLLVSTSSTSSTSLLTSYSTAGTLAKTSTNVVLAPVTETTLQPIGDSVYCGCCSKFKGSNPPPCCDARTCCGRMCCDSPNGCG